MLQTELTDTAALYQQQLNETEKARLRDIKAELEQKLVTAPTDVEDITANQRELQSNFAELSKNIMHV